MRSTSISTYNQDVMTQRRVPFRLLAVAFILSGAFLTACASDSAPAGAVHVLTWKGEVNPVMERYIKRGLDAAQENKASAVVLKLDTPGGLDTSMRQTIQRMQSSTVPVIVYVAPSGGRAASAGTFIT